MEIDFWWSNLRIKMIGVLLRYVFPNMLWILLSCYFWTNTSFRWFGLFCWWNFGYLFQFYWVILYSVIFCLDSENIVVSAHRCRDCFPNHINFVLLFLLFYLISLYHCSSYLNYWSSCRFIIFCSTKEVKISHILLCSLKKICTVQLVTIRCTLIFLLAANVEI